MRGPPWARLSPVKLSRRRARAAGEPALPGRQPVHPTVGPTACYFLPAPVNAQGGGMSTNSVENSVGKLHFIAAFPADQVMIDRLAKFSLLSTFLLITTS